MRKSLCVKVINQLANVCQISVHCKRSQKQRAATALVSQASVVAPVAPHSLYESIADAFCHFTAWVVAMYQQMSNKNLPFSVSSWDFLMGLFWETALSF